MRFKYTEIHIDFLEQEYKKTPMPELVDVFNKKFNLNITKHGIKSTLTRFKIRCGRKVGTPKGRSRLFTKSQVLFIAEKYQLHSPKRVAHLLNKTCNGCFTEAQIASFVHNNSINCGRTGQFKKDHEPWNKGTKGVMKANSGTYKKGDVPRNLRPIGSQRTTKDGYRAIKVAYPRKWELLHRHNWALVHGYENMPENLRFKDGNILNCEVSNLEPVSNQEHMILNQMGYNQMPDEVKPVVLNLAKIDVKTQNLRKGVAA